MSDPLELSFNPEAAWDGAMDWFRDEPWGKEEIQSLMHLLGAATVAEIRVATDEQLASMQMLADVAFGELWTRLFAEVGREERKKAAPNN